MTRLSSEDAAAALHAALNVNPNVLTLSHRRLPGGWLLQHVDADGIGARPWVVSDTGDVATVPFGAAAAEVLAALAAADG